MTVSGQTRVLKVFESFILGYCKCGCGKPLPRIRTSKCLVKYILGHTWKGRKRKIRMGMDSNGWKLGRSKRGKYWVVRINGKHVLEHVYFFEQYYKCCMLPWGEVHHIDPVRKGYCNNMIWNLQGMTKSQHRSHHNPSLDTSDRECSNPECVYRDRYRKRKNGTVIWSKDDIGGWLCRDCVDYFRYIKNKFYCG